MILRAMSARQSAFLTFVIKRIKVESSASRPSLLLPRYEVQQLFIQMT